MRSKAIGNENLSSRLCQLLKTFFPCIRPLKICLTTGECSYALLLPAKMQFGFKNETLKSEIKSNKERHQIMAMASYDNIQPDNNII